MKKFVCIFIFLQALFVFSQNPNRQFEKYTQNQNLVIIETNDGSYQIKFLSEQIVETSFIPTGETYNPESHAVILSEPVKMNVTDNEFDLDLSSKGICVTVKKNPFQLIYNYKDKTLLSERLGYTFKDDMKVLNFNIGAEDVLYGGGNRVLGMNHRGYKLNLYNRAHYGYETHSELMNYTMPLVFSSQIFAVNFDNAPIGYLDLDSEKNNTLNYGTISGRMTYQVVAHDSWAQLIEEFTTLTGRQPLPPRWAFGNFASRFGYHSQAEVEKTVDLFREHQIPLDAAVIDIYWFSKGIFDEMGDLEFEKDSFPNPEKMLADLKQKGVKTVLVTEPFILTTSNRWNEAVQKDILVKDSLGNPKTWKFYFGNTSLIDIYKPEAADWFWQIYKRYTEMGVSGVWGDLGEPEVHPFDALHAKGTADEVHNIYGHDWARLVFEGFQKDFPKMRPFILMRAGAVGSQRYGMIPWTGDVNRSWGGLQAQPQLALQAGMQGMAYMHADAGGFGGDNPDDELYTRWLQYSLFTPVFRPHAQEAVPSEPVYRSKEVMALAKKTIEMRYRLLPYTYTLAFRNHQTGMPFMRPLFYNEPDNKELLTYDQAYLWGENFLIAPIVNAGETQKEIYFPKGNQWIDFYTNAIFEGGNTHTVSLDKEHIPTFVKSGSFIPLLPVFQSTDDLNLSQMEVHFYFDKTVKESEYVLYNDDGKTPDAFEQTLFEEIEFESEFKKNSLVIEIEPDFGVKFAPYNKQISLVIHHLKSQPKKMKINGKKVKFEWEENFKEVFILPIVLKEDEVKINISF
jgi:oligosaccharide 4-alpha-D-glucosyltransferase